MITRRRFISYSAAPFLLPKIAFSEDVTFLNAENVKIPLLPDQQPTSLWGFNGSMPGPVIRLKQGQQVNVRLKNLLNQPTAVHWHGVRIKNSMDGVPGLTQAAVSAGEDFLYKFTVPDAGTYWYHSHHRSWEQVAKGLYGALIVEEKNLPKVQHDIVVFFDDWRLSPIGSQIEDFENPHDLAHDGRLGNFAKVLFSNANPAIKRYQKIRLRLINVATDRVFPIKISGIEGKLVAYDGMPIKILQPIKDIVLSPSQRADIIGYVTADEIAFTFDTPNGPYQLGSLKVAGEIAKPKNMEIVALSENDYQAPDIKNAQEHTINFDGGAMSRSMMMGSGVWSINGQTGMPNKPLYTFKLGQTVVLELFNNTMFDHAIHLHGHHFQAVDFGVLSPMRDTILVKAGKKQKIACVFNNPGKWMLHCHMLAHQASGMATWFQIA